MISDSSRLLIAAAGLLLVASNPVMAHGTKKHSDEKNAATAVEDAEQMPWGIAGSVQKVERTVEISTLDQMRFEPSSLQVKRGETIKFLVKNDGKVMHEFVLGTQETNDKHAALMMKFPGMEHDAPYMAHVAPGKTG